MKKISISRLLVFAVVVVAALPVKAQVNTFGAGYFHNQYLLNPAMAGATVNEGEAMVGYKKQGDVPNGPKMMYATASYGFHENMGIGLQVINDKAGILDAYKFVGSFSYHIPIGQNDQKLSFGASAGGWQQRIDNYHIEDADADDPLLYDFNDREMRFEADFGVAYTDHHWNIQAAMNNLVSNFSGENKNVVNRSMLYAAASYKYATSDDEGAIFIEPKVAYRMIEGQDDLIDAGLQLSFLDARLGVMGMYHSSKNVTAGASFRLWNTVEALAIYSTQPKDFSVYSGGDLEFGLRFLFK